MKTKKIIKDLILKIWRFSVAIGDGKISLNKVLRVLQGKEEEKTKKTVKQKTQTEGIIEVDGISNLLCHTAKCCKPIPGDKIIGIITKGKVITIHIKDCPNAKNILEKHPEKKVDIKWREDLSGAFYNVALRVISEDRPGLLAEVSSAIASQKSNISNADIRIRADGKAINDFIISIKNKNHLDKVLSAIKTVKGVNEVFRLQKARWFNF